MKKLLITILSCIPLLGISQNTLSGVVRLKSDNSLVFLAKVIDKNTMNFVETNEKGEYKLENLSTGKHIIIIESVGQQSIYDTINLTSSRTKNYLLESLNENLEQLVIEDESLDDFGKTKLYDIEGTYIYAAKKTEVISPDNLTVNKAGNKGRQVFSQVVGLNIWESDASGLQLDIGGRGLNPSRTSNFNTRQNGYDIAADALGYPESYYTPAAEAVDRIEIIRGAASLQYGTQFGGAINFKMKDGNPNSPFEFTTRQSVGSYGFFNSFNSVGGQINEKLNYYAHYNYKEGKSWRDNSHFKSHNAYTSLKYKANKKLLITGEYTYLYYLAQQPGGLTDKQFEEDASASYRSRNWFEVHWNVMALKFDFKLSEKNTLSINNFGLIADRNSLGLLTRPDRTDNGGPRDLIKGNFNNFGNETRFLHRYKIKEQKSILVIGGRYYQGKTINEQGVGDDGEGPDFSYVNSDQNDHSYYTYPSRNIALFAENVFYIGKKVSITPGVRYDYILTQGEGSYTQVIKHPSNPNLILGSIDSSDTFYKKRNIFLAGIGVAYRPKGWMEVYGNISKNYRAITFNDMKVINPNFKIDPNLEDEKGYTTDIGIRGKFKNIFTYDLSLFYIQYANRIGQVLETDEFFNTYNLRTNIGDSRNYGVEMFAELDVLKLILGTKSKYGLAYFVNTSLVDAYYYNTVKPSIEDNQVEQVPPLTFRTGLTFKYDKFSIGFNYAYVKEHFSDATNSESTPSGIDGIIPSYAVADASLSYEYKIAKIETGVNNLFNNTYFTRRASGYPGPGIIPAEPLTWYMTLQLKLTSKRKK